MTSNTADSIARARSLLFVPGHRPDRFGKASESHADAIVLDLEDAVGPDVKDEARHNIRRWINAGGPGIIRINGPDTQWYHDDVAALQGGPRVVMLPKVTSAAQVRALLDGLAPGSWVMPLLETAAGILGARDVCAAQGVLRAVFGNADLARELGIDLADQSALAFARSWTVLASAACGLTPPVDGVTAALTNDNAISADTEHARAFGFTGKLCLHPRQVDTVNQLLSPSEEEIRQARDVLAAVGDGSVTMLNGQVVGKPIIERARLVLRRMQ